jgi:hypothetical protein
MTAEFMPDKYKKWGQRMFYVAVVLGVAAVVIGQFVAK